VLVERSFLVRLSSLIRPYLVGVWCYRDRANSGRLARGSRPCRLEASGEAGKRRRLGMCRGKCDAHPACGLDDAGSDLDETHPQGRELGASQRLRLGNGVAQSEHQPEGPGMQYEPHLVGER
jgi:hypothetical protein